MVTILLIGFSLSTSIRRHISMKLLSENEGFIRSQSGEEKPLVAVHGSGSAIEAASNRRSVHPGEIHRWGAKKQREQGTKFEFSLYA